MSTANPARLRIVEWRPSAPTTSFAAISISPPSVLARRPVTRPSSSISSVAFGLHHEMKCRIAAPVLGEKVEEIPLRHQRDELTVRRQMRKVGDVDGFAGDDGARGVELVVRQRQEVVEPSELVEQLERRRVNRVAAKVAEEVGIFLKDGRVDAGACEQYPEHHSAGATSDDADVRRRIHAATKFSSLSVT